MTLAWSLVSLCGRMGPDMEQFFFKLPYPRWCLQSGGTIECFDVRGSCLSWVRCRIRHPGQLTGTDEQAVSLGGGSEELRVFVLSA